MKPKHSEPKPYVQPYCDPSPIIPCRRYVVSHTRLPSGFIPKGSFSSAPTSMTHRTTKAMSIYSSSCPPAILFCLSRIWKYAQGLRINSSLTYRVGRGFLPENPCCRRPRGVFGPCSFCSGVASTDSKPNDVTPPDSDPQSDLAPGSHPLRKNGVSPHAARRTLKP